MDIHRDDTRTGRLKLLVAPAHEAAEPLAAMPIAEPTCHALPDALTDTGETFVNRGQGHGRRAAGGAVA